MPTIYRGLLSAAESGQLSRRQLEESVERIWALKKAYGLTDAPIEPPDLDTLNAQIRAILP